MNPTPSYYSIIPANVRYDKELCPNEKLLYGEITSLCNTTGKCTAGNQYFADLYDKAKETISRWISHLERKGYISTTYIRLNNEINNQQRIITLKDENKSDLGTPVFIGVPDESKNNYEDEQKENTEECDLDESQHQGVLTKISRGIDENVKGGIDENVKENNTRFNIVSINDIYKHFENCFKKPITEMVKFFFETWIKVFNGEIIMRAIDIAVENEVLKISYLNGILNNWKQSNYKSLDDINKNNKRNIEIPQEVNLSEIGRAHV